MSLGADGTPAELGDFLQFLHDLRVVPELLFGIQKHLAQVTGNQPILEDTNEVLGLTAVINQPGLIKIRQKPVHFLP